MNGKAIIDNIIIEESNTKEGTNEKITLNLPAL